MKSHELCRVMAGALIAGIVGMGCSGGEENPGNQGGSSSSSGEMTGQGGAGGMMMNASSSASSSGVGGAGGAGGAPLICGDGIISNGEECDDGNKDLGDGCDVTCHVEFGYGCSGEPSVCTNIDDCAPNPCQNGGTCVDGFGVYACVCPAGFTGMNCETNVDNCSPNPCQNGGTCVDGIDTFTCICAPGYEGPTCVGNINECNVPVEPCQHGGTCIDGLNGYTCSCKPGYSGANCETNIDDCAANPCLNGATCIDGVNSYTCMCAPGWKGLTCDLDIDECLTNNGGCGAQAQCTNMPGSRTCTCKYGYAGDGVICTAVQSPSCNGLAATCGPMNNENCCASNPVTGGTYNRGNNAMYPATVSDFQLDRFEITVGRFRKFVEAYTSNNPGPGDNAGAHPLIAGTGWKSAWNSSLPATQTALKTSLKCDATYATWTDTPGANESKALNCLSWYTASAFCAWDGGRLPTEAEWNYAAAGGSEQRYYPWSNPPASTTIDPTYAVYFCTGDGSAAGNCTVNDLLAPGARSPKGDGKWGHADLGGNIFEWTFDWYFSYSTPCVDCASTMGGTERVIRGGSWYMGQGTLQTANRLNYDPTIRNYISGARCAKTP